jgi:hypothetical protein
MGPNHQRIDIGAVITAVHLQIEEVRVVRVAKICEAMEDTRLRGITQVRALADRLGTTREEQAELQLLD